MKYIRAKIKTQAQIAELYPEAILWGTGIRHSPCEIVLSYLGKTVWLKKARHGFKSFYYEIIGNEVIVIPDWIDYFDSDELLPPVEIRCDSSGEIMNDMWLDPYEDRLLMIGDLFVITG